MLDGRGATQAQEPANPGDSRRLLPLAGLTLLLSLAGFAALHGLLYRLYPDGAAWHAHAAAVIASGLVVALAASSALRYHFGRVERLGRELARVQALGRQFERLFELSPDMLCVAGTDARFKRINPAFEATLGYSRDELLSRCFVDFVHPEDRDDTLAAVARLAAGQPVPAFTNRYRHSDGSYRLLEWRSIPYADNLRIIAAARDVTEMHRQRQALIASERRYRLLFEHMSDGVAVYRAVDDGRDFVFLEFNKASERIGRIGKDQVIGRSVRDVFPGIIDAGLFDVMREVWQSGRAQRHPISQYLDDRITLWVENFVFRLPSGEIVAVYNDVTERKQHEQQLLDSERRFRTLFEQAPIGIDVVSPEGRPIRVNLALQRMLGYSEAEMRSRHFSTWTHPEDLAPSAQLVERLRRGEAEQLSLNKRYLRKDGATVWAHTAVAAVRNGEGGVEYFIAMVEDVTEHHHKAQETRRLLEENRFLARRLLRVQEQERALIARELHDEVGQSLTGIRADAQAIIALCEGDALRAARTSAAAIDQVAERLYASIHELMRRLRPYLLDDLGAQAGLDELLRQWQRQHPQINCALQLRGSLDTLPEALAIVVYRVVQEGLTNVARHAQATAVRLHLDIPRGRGAMRLTLSDNGRGFTHAGRPEGMGLLGMRERVLAVGGTFELRTAPSRGMRLNVEIPV
jgi:PAS domain S-box-containing protein